MTTAEGTFRPLSLSLPAPHFPRKPRFRPPPAFSLAPLFPLLCSPFAARLESRTSYSPLRAFA